MAKGRGRVTLRLLQHGQVFLLFARQASQESIHVEVVKLTSLLLLSRWPIQVLPVSVEETCKAADESCSHTICVEG
jgi:hypothetical protein